MKFAACRLVRQAAGRRALPCLPPVSRPSRRDTGSKVLSAFRMRPPAPAGRTDTLSCRTALKTLREMYASARQQAVSDTVLQYSLQTPHLTKTG